MVSDWEKVKLSDLIEITHGFAFKGEFFRDDETDNILLTPGNFAVGGGFKGEKFKFYDGPVPEDYVLKSGDLIVTMTDLSKGSDTLGYPALVRKAKSGKRFLHNQRLGKVVIKDKKKTDYMYLYYLMCTKEYRNEILASATGSTVKHTSPSRIGAFEFCLPPLSIQVYIGQVLNSFDCKIGLDQLKIATLEAMARELYKSWFVDFDPVSARDRGLDISLSRPVGELFPDSFEETEVGKTPKGWISKALYDCAKYTNGAAFKTEHFSSDRKGWPIVKIGELKDGISDQTKFTEGDFESKYKIQSGDILFSWSGSPDTSIDTFIWAGGEGWLNQHIFKIEFLRPKEKVFVFFMLKHFKPVFVEIARNKQTTGLGHVTAKDLKRLMTAIPNDEVLDAFNKIAFPLFDRIYAIYCEIQELAKCRDLLLPKLITGEIQVE